MPRLVRKRPLTERIKDAVNPFDFFLWLSEEIETRDLGSKPLGTQLGLGFNFLFLLARANGGSSSSADDVFSDSSGSGWFPWLSWTLAWMLAAISIWNAAYTLWRSRAYRLFEANVERSPGTPSAYRTRVQSSPSAAASPLRLLTDILAESAESRAHPDKTRDVWEIRLWDPLPASLQLICLFSPVHVLLYMLSLPLAPLDPRPSVTVCKCITEQFALSSLLLTLESLFTRQNKDSALIQKEVMREYDTKYVHPRLHPTVRDAATQCGTDDDGRDLDAVEVGTPTVVINRGFQTHPNQNYKKHFDPDYLGSASTGVSTSRSLSPPVSTPKNKPWQPDLFPSVHNTHSPRPSPLRQSMPASSQSIAATAEPPLKPMPTNSGMNFGGSLGVYTHGNSPLKKTTSLGDMNGPVPFSPRNSREMAALEQQGLADRLQRRSSPLKENRRNTFTPSSQILDSPSSPNPFANIGVHRSRFERFPSRR